MSSVTLNEVLEVLSSRTAASSNFGTMLDMVRDGLASNNNGYDSHRVSELEDRMLHQGAVYRCVDELSKAGIEVIGMGKGAYPALSKLRLRSERVLPAGFAVVKCLRVYQEWSTREPVRGLAAVFGWMCEVAPGKYKAEKHDEDSLTQAFIVGKAKASRRAAAEVYADCYLAAANWVNRWNAAQKRPARAA